MTIDTQQIHLLILKAQVGPAREKLLRWSRGGVQRAHAVDFARLAWRTGLPKLGVHVLHPIVRPSARRPKLATPPETAEYAQCLIKYGALAEGEALLRSLDTKLAPHSLFYRASACIARLDYAGSVPLLTQYIDEMADDPYQRRVAEVNIAMALVYEGHGEEAEARLNALEAQTQAEGLDLLFGRVLEIHAYNDTWTRRWKDARARLEEAMRRLKGSPALDEFLVRKLAATVDFLERGDEKAEEALRLIRQEAVKRRHWETIRDCDRNFALARGDEALLFKLYFGTPYARYRTRLAGEAGRSESFFPSSYLWVPPGGEGTGKTIALDSGSVGEGEECLDPGSVPHRLFAALLSDLYRPSPLVSLFSAVYPDRLFHPVSSPGLVYDAATRLRRLLKRQRLPLCIDPKEGFYHLTAVGPCAVGLSISPPSGRQDFRLARLAENCQRSEFTLARAVRALALPKRSVQRLLRQAVEKDGLMRLGKGARTRYAFPS